MNLTPTTVLEAVNSMLSVIGEAPVNSLNSGHADVQLAQQILTFASREVQVIGWHWNSEENYPISPNQVGELVLPSNTLKVDTTDVDADLDLVQRGQRLYDRVNHTYTFSRAVKVHLVLHLGFDEIPEAARNYITIRATRQFQERVIGNTATQAFNAQDEMRAMADLRHAEAEAGDYNMLTGSRSVAAILDR